MGILIFNCIGIGFIAGAVLGYWLGYDSGKVAEEERNLFERFDVLIERVKEKGVKSHDEVE